MQVDKDANFSLDCLILIPWNESFQWIIHKPKCTYTVSKVGITLLLQI